MGGAEVIDRVDGVDEEDGVAFQAGRVGRARLATTQPDSKGLRKMLV